jgi:hypothetical protein
MTLWLGDKVSSIAAKSLKIMERSFVQDFIAVIIVT